MNFLRKLAILAAGWALVAVGVILIPLPGPGILVLGAGIMVLSLKSPRARLLVSRVKSRLRKTYPDGWLALDKFKNALRRRLSRPGLPK